MSSTNRNKTQRSELDYYVTPKKCIKEFLLTHTNPVDIWGELKWLDPCAGGDTSHGMSYPEVIRELYPETDITTNDIRPDSLAEHHTDYLETSFVGYDIIITNPPFFLAKEIIKKALKEVNGGAW